MSTVIAKNVQVGTSGTAAQNFTLYQPASPDGTVRLANGNSGTTTDLVTVTSAGNVGIGTGSPVAKLQTLSTGAYNGTVNSRTGLHLQGNNITGGLANTRIQFSYDPASPKAYIEAGLYGADYLSFGKGDGSGEAMRIDSSGNLLVGKTTTGISTTGWALKPSYNSEYSFDMGGTTNECFNYNNTGTGTYDIAFRYQSATKGYIRTTSTTVSFTNLSDYRLKEDIQPMQGALAKVALLKPCTYKWKSDGSDGQGFIAHELQEVVSDAVTGEKDAVREDGTPYYQGIDTSFLVATLTAAIQEQQAIIEALTTRITALETP